LYNQTHSYDAFFNSSRNRRGVGILVSKKLSYTVEKIYRDTDENILGLVLKIDDTVLRIFSIYGPNHDDLNFYNKLDEFLKEDPLLSAVRGLECYILHCPHS
jgi:exonuclease III